MSTIELEPDAFQVDAGVIAASLGIEAAAVHSLMRDGQITSTCERGVGDDDGRYRLTFFLGNRRLRLIVDEAGTIVKSSTIDFGKRPLPASLHRPGG
ncbi:DUF6522 family protein [Aureimonas glaciei]|uniref:DUF6522 family protein n=1 Tax=Aureimonas glaciei TaxID=1776957 RepID=UPI0016689387|nr:DUF6522 family protein [Aureimonas glaciei]